MRLITCLALLTSTACAGSQPTVEDPAPQPEPAPVAPVSVETTGEGASKPATEAAPEPARSVTLKEVKLEGSGTTDQAVRAAVEPVLNAYEECYSQARAEHADAKGIALVTLLYKAGERKSVAASYSGPGSAVINRCFTEASSQIQLTADKQSESTTIVLRLALEKPAGE